MATITAIEANHCPGAVMFMFEGDFGRILHTGDFRFHPQILKSSGISIFFRRKKNNYKDYTCFIKKK